MKHKIVLEINGVRHKLIKSRTKSGIDVCEKCSICKECKKTVDGACLNLNEYFRKCKPGE
jgi:hypothetical protein